MRKMKYFRINFVKFILVRNMQNLKEENLKLLLKNTKIDFNKWKRHLLLLDRMTQHYKDVSSPYVNL